MLAVDSTLQQHWEAALALEFAARDGATRLTGCRHRGPLCVQKALYPEGAAVCQTIILHPPAGIAGGDRLQISAALAAGTHAQITTPGAGKWYRSGGPEASQELDFALGRDAVLEWLPQETIVYDGAFADISWEAHLASDARLIAWDIVCLGRTGSGERFDNGRCRIETRLVRDGRLAWLERGQIGRGCAVSSSPAGLDGAPVLGTMIAAAPAIDDAWLAACREVAPRRGESAVTRLPGLIVARYRGDSTEAARMYFVELWKRLRLPIAGREAIEPRIWRT